MRHSHVGGVLVSTVTISFPTLCIHLLLNNCGDIILSMAFKYFDRVPLGLTIPEEIVSIEFKCFDFVSLLNVKLQSKSCFIELTDQ